MMRRKLLVQMWCAALLAAPLFAQRDLKYESNSRRVALVVGNNKYPKAPLVNAVNDARAMGQTLRELGFDVDLVTDAGGKEMDAAVNRFASKLSQGDVALFYYAGHGAQIDGENYLVPTDFPGGDEADLKFKTQSASWVQAKLDRTGAQLKIIILDACRTNPFRVSRAMTGGLAQMQGGRGSFIAFATAAGKVANDNVQDNNGLFTKHLVQVMKEPGLSLDEVFNRVRADVDRVSGGEQLPYVYSGVIGQFYFKPAPASGSVKPTSGVDGPAVPAIRVTSAVVTRSVTPQIVSAYLLPAPESDFLTTDPFVSLQYTYDGGHKGEKNNVVEWVNPFGVVVQQSFGNQAQEGGTWAYVNSLRIAGQQPHGTWHVRFSYEGQRLIDIPFHISIPPPSVVNLVSSTLLPIATRGAPYSFTLMARGGKMPYRWSGTDVPLGMTLSADGVLSGAPSARGGFRFVVRVVDSDGNELTRAMALCVAEPPPSVHVTSMMLTKSFAEPDACAAASTVSHFSNDDKAVYFAFRLEGVKQNESGQVYWIHPSGTIAASSTIRPGDAKLGCFTASMQIKDTKPERSPGEWRVRIFWNGGEASSTTFSISQN